MLNIDDRLIKEVSPKIGPNALSTLLAIAIHLNHKTERCFPSHFRLMELTGLGKNSLYDALKVLKDAKLLLSEQRIDSKKKQFGRRVFRLNTDLIGVFIPAADVEPLPESREPESREPESREPESREPENRETQLINEVKPINEVELINNVGERNAPALSPTLEEKPLVANDIPPAAPTWGGFPKAETPAELLAELLNLYKAYPNEWDRIKAETPAKGMSHDKIRATVAAFCEWAIGEGWERRTYRQINARLSRWFKDEPLMARRPAESAAPAYEAGKRKMRTA